MYHTIVKLICINGKLMKQVKSFDDDCYHDYTWTACSYHQLQGYVNNGGTKVEWL